jgi:tetratricopeptide (TPR) repeat protein
VSTLLIGLLGAVISTNPVAAASNLVQKTTGISVPAEDPLAAELQKLEEADDAALEEIDKWILENEKFAAEGAGISKAELNARIHKRLDEVRKAYDDFIKRHPDYADARLAYASFLSDIGEEDAGFPHLEKARELAPTNPAVWNNLANYHGHRGAVTNSFAYYEKAISLNPTEPVYFHNFGTTVFLFRKDAREFYGIDEQQVFDKALTLYSNAMKLDPTNFVLAADVAQSYYGIKPMRTNDALQSWTNAWKVATTDTERQGVDIHFARMQMLAGNYPEARRHLDGVTNGVHQEVKQRLLRSINERAAAAATNSVSTSPSPTNAVEPEKTSTVKP